MSVTGEERSKRLNYGESGDTLVHGHVPWGYLDSWGTVWYRT